MTGLAGVLPVISTPFDAGWQIDFPALHREIEYLLESGVDGVVIAMVSEILRLTDEERKTLAEEVVAAISGRGKTVVSVGHESTDRAMRLVEHAVGIGADAVMANPPLTVPSLSNGQLVAYYSAIADAAGELPLIVQDASGYIGTPLDLASMVELWRRYGPQKVQFKPEAEPLGARLSRLLELTDGEARVFEGTGGSALVDNYQRGVVGTLPGPDLVWALVPLWDALVRKDLDVAYRIQEGLAPVLNLVSGLDSYVAIEKHLLVRQGVFRDARQRQPVGFELDHQTRGELDRLVDRLESVISEVTQFGNS